MYVFEKLFVFISVERGSNVKGDSISPEVKGGKEAIWKPCVSITGCTSHDEWWTLGCKSGNFQFPSMPQFLSQKERSHLIL